MVNALNQNSTKFKFDLDLFMTSGSNSKNNDNSNAYYAKKGEPAYQKGMDADEDGIVTFDEFRTYCKENGISSKEMKQMLQTTLAYKLSKNVFSDSDKNSKKTESKEPIIGDLDIIYAKDGDDKYDSQMDTNGDSKISYREYLRYCEQNAKTEQKLSDTKIIEDKSRFMTVSYGHAANAYNKTMNKLPDIKAEGNA